MPIASLGWGGFPGTSPRILAHHGTTRGEIPYERSACMATLLIQHATLLAAMDDQDQRWADGALLATDHVITQVGSTQSLPDTADQVIDASGMVILPGLVNTHHHFYQTLTRAMPQAQNADLFHWLTALYPVWSCLTPEAIRVSTAVAIAELMLSGCTTASDHTYI